VLTRTVIARRVRTFLQERRRKSRLFDDEEIILVIDNETHVARVIDRSARGLGIIHTFRLRIGDEIQLLTPSNTLTATVIWSKDEDGTFRSGLRIE